MKQSPYANKPKSLELNSAPEDRNRLFFIDFLKAISIVVVVSFHAIFVPISTYADSWVLLETIFAPFKFCVPVLLTISFFLLEKSIQNRRDRPLSWLIKKRLARLAVPTVFWFGLMLVLKAIEGDLSFNLEIVEIILTGKIFTGSYFLCVLFQAIPLFILIRGLANSKLGMALAISSQSLFFIFIASALHNNFAKGFIEILQIIGLPLFFYWFIYLVFGAFFYKNFNKTIEMSQNTPAIVKCSLILLSAIFLCSEYYQLIEHSSDVIAPFDYALVSCIFSSLVMLFCFISIEESQFSPKIASLIKTFSKYSLGIFCINGIISRFFMALVTSFLGDSSFGFLEMLIMKLAGWIFLLLISLGLAVLLKRIGLKQMVC